MSHFGALIIMTPQYEAEHSVDESLEKYDENRRVPEYIAEEVDDYEKVNFLTHYNEDNVGKDEVISKKFYEDCKDTEGFFTKEQLAEHWGRKVEDITDEKYINATPYWNKELYANWFKSTYPEVWEKFDECYEENGDEWNSNTWRYHEGKLVRYSTYNPDSVYDYYTEGWGEGLKTKEGEFVNECLLGEIDWSPIKPEEYCKKWEKDWLGNEYHPLKKSSHWRFTEDAMPHSIFIDGEYHSRSKMGWWAMEIDKKENWNEEAFNLIKNLPEDSSCYLLDMHI